MCAIAGICYVNSATDSEPSPRGSVERSDGQDRLIAFATPGYEGLLNQIARATPVVEGCRCRFERFADGELSLTLERAVRDEICVVLGSLAPPDEQTLCTLLLADTLRRAGARRIVAMLPYLGYGRQDRPHRNRSVGAAWVGCTLAACGADRVLTVDVHSPAACRCFPMPVDSISPAPLFLPELRRERLDRSTIVAPDQGAIERATDIARALGSRMPVTYLRKERSGAHVTHRELVGEVGTHVVLVDDILDTGTTLLSACQTLAVAGVEEIVVMATHGTLSGDRWRELPAHRVKRVVLTDTIPSVLVRAGEGVDVLPVASLLARALQDHDRDR